MWKDNEFYAFACTEDTSFLTISMWLLNHKQVFKNPTLSDGHLFLHPPSKVCWILCFFLWDVLVFVCGLFWMFFPFFVNDRCTWQYVWPWVVHLSKQDSPVLPGCLCILRELLLRGVSQERQKHDVHTKPSASWFIYREKGHINLLKGKEKWRIWLTLSV